MRRPRQRLLRVTGKPSLAVDFIGVLFLRRGTDADGKIVGKVVDGAGDFLVEASKHFTVSIWSEHTRRGGLETIKRLLLPALEGPCGSRNNAFRFLNDEIKWPTSRGDHFLWLDDRGFRFDGNFPNPVDLLKLKPWWMEDDRK